MKCLSRKVTSSVYILSCFENDIVNVSQGEYFFTSVCQIDNIYKNNLQLTSITNIRPMFEIWLQNRYWKFDKILLRVCKKRLSWIVTQ